MLEKKVIISAEHGLHVRPGGQLVQLVKSYINKNTQNSVFIELNGKSVKAQSLISLQMLGIRQGNELTVKCDGPDASEMLQKICDFLVAMK